ncbi:MAG: CDP-diacylglycerol--glycerol-3-phosphate 3-phosphatidyltransferase [Clostridia bacterium]|nr:CDP-diacylglycerol--glycerol-3-phosphate 3-phosphatidyltransferase [Clostridia bacterium]
MNLPNKLSLMRIILVPIMAVVYLLPEWGLFAQRPWICAVAAVALFIIAAFTDFLDGHIARKYNLVTDLGKLLDPIADKLLVMCALLLVIEQGILPIGIGSLCGFVIIGREFVISIVRQVGASKNVIIAANMYGKVKAVAQYIALPLLMLMVIDFGETLNLIVKIAAFVTFGASVVLSIISLVVYLVQNRKVFK